MHNFYIRIDYIINIVSFNALSVLNKSEEIPGKLLFFHYNNNNFIMVVIKFANCWLIWFNLNLICIKYITAVW